MVPTTRPMGIAGSLGMVAVVGGDRLVDSVGMVDTAATMEGVDSMGLPGGSRQDHRLPHLHHQVFTHDLEVGNRVSL